jgi:hypothetical protein
VIATFLLGYAEAESDLGVAAALTLPNQMSTQRECRIWKRPTYPLCFPRMGAEPCMPGEDAALGDAGPRRRMPST